MCIIIHKPKGATLSRDIYMECFTRNDDGAGVAFVDPEQGIVVRKGLMKFKKLYDLIKDHEQEELLIHFRIQTHGKIDDANCHPFYHKSQMFPKYTFAVAHNGQLPYHSTEHKSDTHCFTDEVLFPQLDRDPWFLDHPPGRFLMETFMTTRNKVVVMRHNSETGEVKTVILNRKEGNESNGCWFSNYSWLKTPVSNYEFGRHGHWGGGAASGYYRGSTSFSPEDGAYWDKALQAMCTRDGWYLEGGIWKQKDYGTISKPPVTPPLPKPVTREPVQSTLPIVVVPDKKPESLVARLIMKAATAKIKGTPNEGKVIAFPNKKPIEVPRDSEARKVGGIDHLNKEEKAMLAKLCREYLVFLGMENTTGMSLKSMLEWSRGDLMMVVDECSDMTAEQVDQWLLSIKRNEDAQKETKDPDAKPTEQPANTTTTLAVTAPVTA